jgi:PAS domain S-box-containing protein
MVDNRKTKEQLINELEELRQRITELEASQAASMNELAVRARVTGRLLQTLDLDERLNTILNEVMTLVQVEIGAIYLVSGKEVALRCWRGMPDKMRAQMLSFRGDEAPLWMREISIFHELLSESGQIPLVAKAEGIQAQVSIPLTITKPLSGKTEPVAEWLGTLVLASRSYDALSEAKVLILQALAEELALAIHHSHQFHQASQRLTRLSVLREIDRAIIRRLSIPEILQIVVEAVPRELGPDAVAISLLNEEQTKSQVCVMRLPNGTIIEEEAFTLANSLLHWLVERQEPVIIYDISRDPRLQMHEKLIRKQKLSSYLAMPLITQDKTIGILHILTVQPKVFAREDVEFFQTLAGQTAIALRSAQLFEQVRQSEQRYRTVFENAGTAMVIIEKDTTISLVNAQAEKLLGYSRDEIEGKKNWAKFVAKEDLTRMMEFHRLRMIDPSAPPSCYESRFIDRWGRIKVILVSVDMIPGTKKSVVSVLDITELKQTQEALRQSQLNYKALVDSVDGIVWEADARTFQFSFVSKQAERILGYPVERWLTEPSFWKDHLHPDDRDWAVTFCVKATEEKRPHEFEYRMIAADGRTVWLRDIVTVVVEDDQPIKVRGLMVDTTERKKMQEQLIVADRLASIGELASGIAHELNNPLTSIIGFSQLLLDKDIPDEVKEDLNVINREAQRTAEVVRNLLTFARKHPPEKKLVDINNIIQAVLQLRAYEQKVSNIQVNTYLAPDLPEVTADGFQLQQVFLNIIINAEHFMVEAHGGGTLTIATERVGNTIKASFADDGPGISEENLKHIFDPFFTTKEVGKGTGLGLSICHGITSEHGGRIQAQSELGKGATFVVELPISK